jgi:hypothetical protein
MWPLAGTLFAHASIIWPGLSHMVPPCWQHDTGMAYEMKCNVLLAKRTTCRASQLRLSLISSTTQSFARRFSPERQSTARLTLHSCGALVSSALRVTNRVAAGHALGSELMEVVEVVEVVEAERSPLGPWSPSRWYPHETSLSEVPYHHPFSTTGDARFLSRPRPSQRQRAVARYKQYFHSERECQRVIDPTTLRTAIDNETDHHEDSLVESRLPGRPQNPAPS